MCERMGASASNPAGGLGGQGGHCGLGSTGSQGGLGSGVTSASGSSVGSTAQAARLSSNQSPGLVPSGTNDQLCLLVRYKNAIGNVMSFLALLINTDFC